MTKLIVKKINIGTLSRLVFATSPPGEKDRLFVVEQKSGGNSNTATGNGCN